MSDDKLDLDLFLAHARVARSESGDWAMDYGMDVPKLVAEIREARVRFAAREQELWERESLAMRQRDAAEAAIERVRAIDAADAATTSRDYGRGYAQALRDVHDALEKTDD